MKHPETAKRMEIALNRANMRPQELADRSGVSKSSISHYVNGSHAPSNISSGKMAQVLEVNPVWLMGFDVPMDTQPSLVGYTGRSTPHYTAPEDFNNGGYWVPVLGDVAAGTPIEAQEEILDWEQLDGKLKGTGTHFGLRIKGNSMEPRMMSGDVVIVREQPTAENGEIVIVKVNGDACTCKKILKQDDKITLIPLNPSFNIITYTAEEVKTKPVVIIGKVIELRAKF